MISSIIPAFLVACILSLPQESTSFTSTPFLVKGGGLCKTSLCRTTVVLSVKKKRRKRRKDEFDPSEDPDALPDFDMDEDVSSTVSPSKAGELTAESGGGLGLEMDFGGNDKLLREAMKGSSSTAIGSAKALLRERDRTLEQTFEFDEVSAPLPQLGNAKTFEAAPVGKKRARAEARKEAALKTAAEEEAASLEELIAELPFVGKKPGEKTTPIKLLETGAWLGIGILVLWEVYLNSPLFERAAPLSPVVY